MRRIATTGRSRTFHDVIEAISNPLCCNTRAGSAACSGGRGRRRRRGRTTAGGRPGRRRGTAVLPEHAEDLGHRRVVLDDVLQHVERHDQVEAVAPTGSAARRRAARRAPARRPPPPPPRRTPSRSPTSRCVRSTRVLPPPAAPMSIAVPARTPASIRHSRCRRSRYHQWVSSSAASLRTSVPSTVAHPAMRRQAASPPGGRSAVSCAPGRRPRRSTWSSSARAGPSARGRAASAWRCRSRPRTRTRPRR